MARGRLVCVHHDAATDDDGFGRAPVVSEMVHQAVRELVGRESMAEAWGALFSTKDIVGIKVNVRAGRRLSTQLATSHAIIHGLRAAGVPPENIIVWDAWNREFPIAGYTLNESGPGARCYGSDHGTVEKRRRADSEEVRAALRPYFDEEPSKVGGKAIWFSRILS